MVETRTHRLKDNWLQYITKHVNNVVSSLLTLICCFLLQHEELVLLLIQLRRDQSNLERWLDMIDQELALLIDPIAPPGSPSRIRAR